MKIEASIIIVTYGGWSLTERCLQSLEEALGEKLGAQWEIIVVDNHSPDETAIRLSGWSDRVHVKLLNENRNFAGGCNVGAAQARGETLVFLNNDTEVPQYALETLLAQLREPEVGAAGCRLLFPDGTAQHAGVAFIRGDVYGRAAFPQHVLHHQDGELAATQGCYEADCVTAACLAVQADIFRAIGGFDERYRNGLEDVDLCLKIRTAGHRIVYRGDVTLAHHEGASRGTGAALWSTPEKLETMRVNDELFVSRWASQLDQDDVLAAEVWDGLLQNQPRSRDAGPASLALVGQTGGIGPAADEARALFELFKKIGEVPAVYDMPTVAVTARISAQLRASIHHAQSLEVRRGSPAVCVPGGPHDAVTPIPPDHPRYVRLAQTQSALDLVQAREVWVTTPALAAKLVEDGLSDAKIRVIASPVIDVSVGSGGAGVVAVVPVHDRALASLVLAALRRLPGGTTLRLLPTVFVRGWESEAHAQLPHAELLSPCSDEARFAAMASSADIVIAADPSDRFERRALVAASVGATPITLNPEGPAASILGESVACSPDSLASELNARVSEPSPRAEPALRVSAATEAAFSAVRAALAGRSGSGHVISP